MEEKKINILKQLPLSQTISFKGAEEKQTFEVLGQNVTILCNGGSHNHGSSKVKLKNIVDYNWENRLYTGQLLAVHMAGKYIAYGIKVVQKTSQNIGIVRVANRENDQRALLRGMKGQIQDISFAYIPTQVILGCVDEEGTLFVHNVEEEESQILCNLLLHVVHTPDPTVSMYHRILWCPYVPEEENIDPDDDGAKLLVLTQGCKAEMWSVGQVNSRYGSGPHTPSDITEGFLEINEHKLPIIDAAFSPDGTALATASLDGDVKFFQVYMHNDNKPRCLHQWQPHGGNALSCLFFLDDHHTFVPDVQFWKFAITGCNNNSILKVWSCESWTCLQTIYLLPDCNRNTSTLCLKAGLDNAAGYLLLSDIQNRILYVLQIHKDLPASSVSVRMVSEFLLPSPILSFGIIDAGVRKLKCSSSTEDLYMHDGVEIDEGNVVAVIIRMYIVQPKSLQECHIVYQPQLSITPATVTENLLVEVNPESEPEETNLKKDIIEPQIANQLNNLIVATDSLISQPNSQPLNLMTPDSFNSPVRRDSIDSAGTLNNSCPETPLIEIKSDNITLPDAPLISPDIPATDRINFQRISKDNFASGGSSPSREVQEILSLNVSSFPNDYFEKNVENMKTDNNFVDPLEYKNPPLPNYPTENESYTNGNTNKFVYDWPQLAIRKFDEIQQNEESQIDGDLESTHEPDLVNYKCHHKEKSTFNSTVTQKIVSLEETVAKQNSLLAQIQVQLTDLQTGQNMREPHHAQLKTAIASQIETTFSVHLSDQKQMIENWMVNRANKEREYQETLLSALSQVVGNHIIDKLDTIVSSEIQKNIIPQIISVLEPMKRQLHVEMTQKLTTTDHLLRENLSKLVQSKCVMDVLGTSVISALKPHIENSFKDTLTNALLPSWERVCQTMFHQMNEVFSQGTKEYTVCLETHLEKQRRSQDKSRDVVSQLQGVSDSMRTNSEHLATTLSNEIQQQMQKTFTSFQDTMKKAMRQEVKEQIDRGFRNHAAVLEDSVLNAVKSRAVTPSPHILDAQVQQTQIQQLIAQGQINAAFQQALSASDLSLVVYTCEKVNPQQVFTQTPCPLQQNVLLSLIQQLSADMTNITDIKYRYLEEAVMNLQATNPMTREHMPIVLKELQRQLTSYISNNPNNKITRQMRMLLMATHSLI